MDGVVRARAERGHSRLVVTTLGEVRVRRIAYRSGVKGAGSLFPRDAVLNLPPDGYSWRCSGWRRCAAGPAPTARHTRSCSPRPGSVSASGSWSRSPPAPPLMRSGSTGWPPVPRLPSRRPEPARTGMTCPRWRARRTARAWRCGRRHAAAGAGPPANGPRTSRSGAAPGRKATSGWRRPEPCSTSSPRSRRAAADPGAGHAPRTRQQQERARAVNRWYTTGITAGRDLTISKIFDEAGRATPPASGPGSRWPTVTSTRSA